MNNSFEVDFIGMSCDRSYTDQSKSFELDTTLVEDAMSKKDFNIIIENQYLFWIAFCMAAIQSDCKIKLISMKINGKILTLFSTYSPEITFIKDFVEDIRKLFVKNCVKKSNFTILAIEELYSFYIREHENRSTAIYKYTFDSLKRQNSDLNRGSFFKFIQPTMQNFCKSIGATCSEGKICTIMECFTGEEKKDAIAFNIEWDSNQYYIYPIPPKKIPHSNDIQTSIYPMYQNKTLCDLTISAKNGSVAAHSIPLYLHGGDMIQNMLTSNMKESIEKKISFEEFSLECIKAFLDFIYLGEEGLKPESFKDRNVDICELLHMAHTYQVHPLVDCCTNLLSLFSSTADIKQIKELAELYNNEHLKELYEHLSSKLNPNRNSPIKV